MWCPWCLTDDCDVGAHKKQIGLNEFRIFAQVSSLSEDVPAQTYLICIE